MVCVLGSSRSGTSLTARVLNLAGVYLGRPDELLRMPDEVNPKGFWEHYGMMRLNERILRALGGNWREPPGLEPGWETSEALAAEREEAHELIAAGFAGQRLWGWKDPRNSLTLPFWRHLLPEVRCVVCLRNPIDVAASLQRRDGLSFERAVDLWTTYVSAALANTEGERRIFIRYESHFEESRETAERLAAFVDCDNAFERPEARRHLDEAIDERLWRHRTSAPEVAANDRLPSSAGSLYTLVGSLMGETVQ